MASGLYISRYKHPPYAIDMLCLYSTAGLETRFRNCTALRPTKQWPACQPNLAPGGNWAAQAMPLGFLGVVNALKTADMR
jgi:hypothetical protein